jgi:hypothetical protein
MVLRSFKSRRRAVRELLVLSLAGALGRFLRVLSVLFLPTLVSTAFAGDVLQAVNAAGTTEFSFKDVSGAPITVTVTQLRVDSSYPYHNALLWGGDIGELPQSVVSEVRVLKGGKTIFVPMSAYGDLGDVKSLSFDSIKRGFRVSLHGGNTAASYDATLFFEGGVLTRREVRVRELPDERWEKTTYSFPGRS